MTCACFEPGHGGEVHDRRLSAQGDSGWSWTVSVQRCYLGWGPWTQPQHGEPIHVSVINICYVYTVLSGLHKQFIFQVLSCSHPVNVWSCCRIFSWVSWRKSSPTLTRPPSVDPSLWKWWWCLPPWNVTNSLHFLVTVLSSPSLGGPFLSPAHLALLWDLKTQRALGTLKRYWPSALCRTLFFAT